MTVFGDIADSRDHKKAIPPERLTSVVPLVEPTVLDCRNPIEVHLSNV